MHHKTSRQLTEMSTGMDFGEKKLGMNVNREQNEMVSDKGREFYEKETGWGVSSFSPALTLLLNPPTRCFVSPFCNSVSITISHPGCILQSLLFLHAKSPRYWPFDDTTTQNERSETTANATPQQNRIRQDLELDDPRHMNSARTTARAEPYRSIWSMASIHAR